MKREINSMDIIQPNETKELEEAAALLCRIHRRAAAVADLKGRIAGLREELQREERELKDERRRLTDFTNGKPPHPSAAARPAPNGTVHTTSDGLTWRD